MNKSSPFGSLLLLLGAGILFVRFTSAGLPPVVASHFAAGGQANGFMPREVYVWLMLALVVGLPLVMALLNWLVGFVPVRFINLPNRDYWLAPERAEESVAFLQSHGTRFAGILAVFLCFVHWLVVRANGQQPSVFPETLFFAGLVAFLVGLGAWVAALVRRFRRP